MTQLFVPSKGESNSQFSLLILADTAKDMKKAQKFPVPYEKLQCTSHYFAKRINKDKNIVTYKIDTAPDSMSHTPIISIFIAASCMMDESQTSNGVSSLQCGYSNPWWKPGHLKKNQRNFSNLNHSNRHALTQ